MKSYGPVVAGIEHDIEEVEGTVFSDEVAPTERIYFLRREVTNFYRAVHPLLSVMTAVERPARDGELLPYLRDVHDHLLLISEEVSAQLDLLATILEANMARDHGGADQGQRSAERDDGAADDPGDRVLAADLRTGFFRQNFAWLIDHISGFPQFLVLGCGGLLVPLVALFLWLRRTRDRPVPEVAHVADAQPTGSQQGTLPHAGGPDQQPPLRRSSGAG